MDREDPRNLDNARPVVITGYLNAREAACLRFLVAPLMVYDHLGRANGFFDTADPHSPADEAVRTVMLGASERLDAKFSVALWQGYRDGHAVTDLHRDDVAVQLVISLGAARPFQLHHADSDEQPVLKPGDAVLFPPHSQDDGGWMHGVPACDSVGERIAIVLRGLWS